MSASPLSSVSKYLYNVFQMYSAIMLIHPLCQFHLSTQTFKRVFSDLNQENFINVEHILSRQVFVFFYTDAVSKFVKI